MLVFLLKEERRAVRDCKGGFLDGCRVCGGFGVVTFGCVVDFWDREGVLGVGCLGLDIVHGDVAGRVVVREVTEWN